MIRYSKHVAEVIVVDNHSSDDSVQYLKENFSEIRLIELPENLGFAGGYNESLKQIDAPYYVLLNSDVQVTENWLGPILEFMDSRKDVGAVQPKILDYKNKEYFEYAGASGGYIDFMGYPFCRGRFFDHLEKDTGQYNDPVEVFWATGACMVIRSDIFHSAGRFDPDFFAHMEEIDLCWRIWHFGQKIYCYPGCSVYHVGGGTLDKSNPRKTFLNFRNNLSMLYKNIPGYKMYWIVFIRLILDAVAAAKFLAERHHKDAWAVFRSHIAFYKRMGSLRKKRRSIQKRKGSHSAMYKKSILLAFYIQRIKNFADLPWKKNE